MTLEKLELLIANARRLEAETHKFAISDDALDPVLAARDEAEEAVAISVSEILGHPPEWSSLYGYDEALDECAVVLDRHQNVKT